MTFVVSFYQRLSLCCIALLIPLIAEECESRAPGRPQNVNLSSTVDSITVNWHAPVDADAVDVHGYTVGWGEGNQYDIFMTALEGRHQHQFVIRDLRPGTEYTITVRAYNDAGDSDPFESAAKTLPGAVFGISGHFASPIGLSSRVVSSSEIELTWIDPTVDYQHSHLSPGRSYTLRWAVHGLASTRFTTYATAVTNKTSYVVSGLTPNTDYEFSVKSDLGGGAESAWSLLTIVKTPSDVPTSAPYGFQLSRVYDTVSDVNLTWKRPKELNGILKGYDLFYTMDNSEAPLGSWNKLEVSAEAQSYVVKHLPVEKTVFFKMRVVNEVGAGPLSALLVHRLSFDTASDPTNLPLVAPSPLESGSEASYYIVPTGELVEMHAGELLILPCGGRENQSKGSRSFSWEFQNGTKVPTQTLGQRVFTLESMGMLQLVFIPVSTHDSGIYICKSAGQNYNGVEKSVTLKVLASVIIDPEDLQLCTFEKDGACGWITDHSPSYQWKRVNSNRIDGLASIVAVDHTYLRKPESGSTGHYMYLQATDGLKGSGRLISPILRPSMSFGTCLTFWHLVGFSSAGRLNIYTYPRDAIFTSMPPIEILDLRPTSSWQQIKIDLKPLKQEFMIVLEAVKLPKDSLLLAIDDVELLFQNCAEVPDEDKGGIHYGLAVSVIDVENYYHISLLMKGSTAPEHRQEEN